jgi:hypothetical protein
MWPRSVVVPVIAITLLMAHTAANPLAGAVPVSGEGGVFQLLESVTVDGGENGNDEARGISVAPDGTVYATGYISVAGQGQTRTRSSDQSRSMAPLVFSRRDASLASNSAMQPFCRTMAHSR